MAETLLIMSLQFQLNRNRLFCAKLDNSMIIMNYWSNSYFLNLLARYCPKVPQCHFFAVLDYGA